MSAARSEPPAGPGPSQGTPSSSESPKGRRAGWLARHKSLFWWAHSIWQLSAGAFVAIFAAKGFEEARWLAPSLVALWLSSLGLFRVFGAGRERELEGAARVVGFYAMTWVLKTLYQGMLFFALPFYWGAASLDAPNVAFAIALSVAALASTLDLFFDGMLMRYRALAATFYGFALFVALGLALPSLAPELPALAVLVGSACAAVLAFYTLHVPASRWRQSRSLGALTLALLLAGVSAWRLAPWIPPVPLSVDRAAVGLERRSDGLLALEVEALGADRVEDLEASVTVIDPSGAHSAAGYTFRWRFEGRPVATRIPTSFGIDDKPRALRLVAPLGDEGLPERPEGAWLVDVETRAGQLVSRVRFEVRGR